MVMRPRRPWNRLTGRMSSLGAVPLGLFLGDDHVRFEVLLPRHGLSGAAGVKALPHGEGGLDEVQVVLRFHAQTSIAVVALAGNHQRIVMGLPFTVCVRVAVVRKL